MIWTPKVGIQETGRPMQEKGSPAGPGPGGAAGVRPARTAGLGADQRGRERARRGQQQIEPAKGGERPFEPPAPDPPRAGDPGGGQQRAGEEAVAGIRVEVDGAGAQRVEMGSAPSALVMR